MLLLAIGALAPVLVAIGSESKWSPGAKNHRSYVSHENHRFNCLPCLRNVRAFTLFGLGWIGVFLFGGLVVTLFAGLIGSAQVAGMAMVPAALLMAAMFFTSVYFSFRDSFVADDAPTNGETS